MPSSPLSSRRLRTLLAALAVAALLWLLFAATERALAVAQRFLALPIWLQSILGAALLALAAAGIVLLWWGFRPRRKRQVPGSPTRGDLETRIHRLQHDGIDTAALGHELTDMDQRRQSARLYVAVFGEISAGKSTLIRALAPHTDLARDVRGGTTRQVSHHDGTLVDGRAMCLADVPGSAEVGGEAREIMAREEALRAHAVVYVCAGDLTRSQMDELNWLGEFGKPLLVAVNKADQWTADERDALLRCILERTRTLGARVVATQAGGSERLERRLADGRSERIERDRPTDIAALERALARLLAGGATAMEPARETAVLAHLHQRLGSAEAQARQRTAQAIVRRYARRAIVGALAAVVPGSDLVIQGALATAMARELGALYGIAITDLEIEAFLKQARMTLRASASVVLAIAGNALKAFPGLGTLTGGVVHAFAYALIFDSLGRALAMTLDERRALDQDAAAGHLRALMTKPGAERLRQLAQLTAETLRDDAPQGGARR